MNKACWTVIALAMTASSALAQPGNTAPGPSGDAPPPGDVPPDMPPPEGRPVTPPGGYVDIDELVARAQAASPTLATIARGAFRRARRAIAVGPSVGMWGGVVPAQDDQEFAITFGLGVETFKVPILPTPETLKQLVMDRAKAKLREQLAARFAGRQLDPISAEQFAREVWEDAVKEVLGLENTRAKTMERPAINFGFEVQRQFKLDAWTPRLRVGIGVSRVTLGATLGVALGTEGYAKTPVYTGLEIVTHFMMSENPRASVFDVFLRADFEMRNRDTNTDQLVLGLRYLLDLI
jgi:hypothetical protein